MNSLQIAEIKREAFLKSKTEYHHNQKLYVLIKNGTSLGKITTEKEIVRHYVEEENYGVYFVFFNGKQLKIDPFRAVWKD